MYVLVIYIIVFSEGVVQVISDKTSFADGSITYKHELQMRERT